MIVTEIECTQMFNAINTLCRNDNTFWEGLNASHWLMAQSLSPDLINILSMYSPGRMLKDKSDRFWVRRATMAIVRFRFISPVGDDQEAFYEQKYLLRKPIMANDLVISTSPWSWIEYSASQGMCDLHNDCLSTIQSAISRGFNIESVRSLAAIYIENRFLTEDEADVFIFTIPVAEECKVEVQAMVTNQLFGDEDGEMEPKAPFIPLPTNIHSVPKSGFSVQLCSNSSIKVGIIGPAGTGKSYLLNAIIELFESHHLVTSKLVPSGAAATVIGGVTVHNYFALDIQYNSSLENGTIQAAKIRKTDVIVIDEFSMLDFFLFRTAEGLCRKFAKQGVSNLP